MQRGMIIAVIAVTSAAVPLALKAQASDYHPLPLENGSWCMTSVCIDFGCGDWGYITTTADGDTLLDGSSYSVMVSHATPMTSGTCCFPPDVSTTAYLLEDTTAKKVYLRTDFINEDSLLYDFNLNVGDTLRGYLASCATATLSVLSIDSVLVGGAYNKRINFDTTDVCDRLAVIEGVGATTGLLACFSEPWDSGITLQCLTVDGTLQYYAPCSPDTAGCAALPLGIGPSFVQGDGSSGCVLTHVTSDLLAIDHCQDLTPSEFFIFDGAGSVCLTGPIVAGGSGIHIGGLRPGLYCIRITDVRGKVSTSQKFFQP